MSTPANDQLAQARANSNRSEQGAATLPPQVEPFVTLHEAASALNLGYWKLQRAARRGLFPRYSFLNGRLLVRLSEVVAAIEVSRQGGGGVE
jgi:hypothetical protein